MRQPAPHRSAARVERSSNLVPLFLVQSPRPPAPPSRATLERRLERAEEQLARWRANVPFLVLAWLCALWMLGQNVQWARQNHAQVSAELTAGKVRWSR